MRRERGQGGKMSRGKGTRREDEEGKGDKEGR